MKEKSQMTDVPVRCCAFRNELLKKSFSKKKKFHLRTRRTCELLKFCFYSLRQICSCFFFINVMNSCRKIFKKKKEKVFIELSFDPIGCCSLLTMLNHRHLNENDKTMVKICCCAKSFRPYSIDYRIKSCEFPNHLNKIV